MQRHKWDPVCRRPDGLVFPVPIDVRGLVGPTRGRARGPYWVRTAPRSYVPAAADATLVEQRILNQAGRVSECGAVTGWASLRWRGASFFDGLDHDGCTSLPVPMAVGGVHQPCGDAAVDLRREQFAPTEREVVAGLACATVQRSLFDEMRRTGSVRDAVVAVDMCAAAGLISVALMWRYVELRSGWTGVPLVRKALTLASEHSRSPQETRTRLVWLLDAGLPAPLCNQPIFDGRGRLLGVPDLLDVEAGLVGEYDGADHKVGIRHRADVARESLFREHLLEYFAVVGGDLSDRRLVSERMLGARRRARFLPAGQRPWTVQPPPGWRVRGSLDERLARAGLVHALTHG